MFEKECKTCIALKEHITFLRKQNETLISEKAAERAEYKRAIDALLVRDQLPAIGQGVAESKGPMDLTAAFGLFEEKDETKEN